MYAVLEIKKNNRLSQFQKPGNQTREFSCPDESLVARQKTPHIQCTAQKASIFVFLILLIVCYSIGQN